LALKMAGAGSSETLIMASYLRRQCSS